jgi:hypothetical protein
MSKRILLPFAGALLLFGAGIGVGMQLGGEEQATQDADPREEGDDDAPRPRRRSGRTGPSFDQWIASASPRGNAPDQPPPDVEAFDPQHEVDGGPSERATQLTGTLPPPTSPEAPSVPESLHEAETVVAAALARGTLTAEDRSVLSALLPDIAMSDRNRLADQIMGALSAGRLTLTNAQL